MVSIVFGLEERKPLEMSIRFIIQAQLVFIHFTCPKHQMIHGSEYITTLQTHKTGGSRTTQRMVLSISPLLQLVDLVIFGLWQERTLTKWHRNIMNWLESLCWPQCGLSAGVNLDGAMPMLVSFKLFRQDMLKTTYLWISSSQMLTICKISRISHMTMNHMPNFLPSLMIFTTKARNT